jgi:superfamily II DNA or RNA helicase
VRSISLDPVPWDTPYCDDYESADEVRRFEREVRVHRACTEPFVVTPIGRADGAYAVTSGSGGRYIVDLVDGSARYDTCTCPDFLANELGTCKHLEATRRAVDSRPALRRALARLDAPARPTITVDTEGTLRLLAVGEWPEPLRRERAHLSRADGLLKAVAARHGASPDGAPRIVHAAAPAAERLARAAWQKRRLRALDAQAGGGLALDDLELPLFPYQRDGVLHLLRAGRALLADDMGLGKTIQAIAACELLRRRGEARRIVVVTAASLKHQWSREIARWTGEKAAVLGASAMQRSAALALEATYTVLSYELTWRELTRLQALGADVLVLDEAQRARNFRTKTASTLRALPSRFLFILTGTPVENRLDDLYSLLQLIDPRLLGPLWRFNLEFHRQDERGRIVGYKNLGELRRRIEPLVVRRERAEVLLDLPPLLEQTRYTPLTAEQSELEEDYRSQAAKLLAIAERRPLRKEEQERLMMYLLKARQACNALELCDPQRKKKASPKLDEMEALIAEIASQPASKVIVFSEWVRMLELAAERIERLRVGYLMLHGDVPTERRPALLDRFRDDPAARVLLSTDAGGVGLNLQAASYVVHLDLPWNPARLDQRTGRAHRLGQAQRVSVTYLCAERGIERGIEGTLATKRAVRMAVLRADAAEEELSAPSFSVFLRQMRDVLSAVEGEAIAVEGDAAAALGEGDGAPGPQPTVAAVERSTDAAEAPTSAGVEGDGEMTALPGVQAPAALPPGDAERANGLAGAAEAHDRGDGRPAGASRSASARRVAEDRLRLARVVLDAGFAADAARAAYEAFAEVIAGMLEGPAPESHAALIAAIYRELMPAARLPVEAHAALARLHDLGTLVRAGVPLELGLARSAVEEANVWVVRLAAADGALSAKRARGGLAPRLSA